MTTSTQPKARRPEGSPGSTGGQYTSTSRGESAGSISGLSHGSGKMFGMDGCGGCKDCDRCDAYSDSEKLQVDLHGVPGVAFPLRGFLRASTLWRVGQAVGGERVDEIAAADGTRSLGLFMGDGGVVPLHRYGFLVRVEGMPLMSMGREQFAELFPGASAEFSGN